MLKVSVNNKEKIIYAPKDMSIRDIYSTLINLYANPNMVFDEFPYDWTAHELEYLSNKDGSFYVIVKDTRFLKEGWKIETVG